MTSSTRPLTAAADKAVDVVLPSDRVSEMSHVHLIQCATCYVPFSTSSCTITVCFHSQTAECSQQESIVSYHQLCGRVIIKTATVNVNTSSLYGRTRRPSRLAWSKGRRLSSTFIRWMAFLWWQYNKHSWLLLGFTIYLWWRLLFLPVLLYFLRFFPNEV